MFIDDVSNIVTMNQRTIFECGGLLYIPYLYQKLFILLEYKVPPTATGCIPLKPGSDQRHFLLHEPSSF